MSGKFINVARAALPHMRAIDYAANRALTLYNSFKGGGVTFALRVLNLRAHPWNGGPFRQLERNDRTATFSRVRE